MSNLCPICDPSISLVGAEPCFAHAPMYSVRPLIIFGRNTGMFAVFCKTWEDGKLPLKMHKEAMYLRFWMTEPCNFDMLEHVRTNGLSYSEASEYLKGSFD